MSQLVVRCGWKVERNVDISVWLVADAFADCRVGCENPEKWEKVESEEFFTVAVLSSLAVLVLILLLLEIAFQLVF